MTPYLGELAALLTALLFSATSTFFTLAGRQVGSLVLNRTRLLLAILFLLLAHLLLHTPLPFDAGPERLFWLSISGVVGLVLGDAFLFQAFVWIGPRMSMLLMSLAPVIAALLAWLFLSESLGIWQVTGILITLTGIAVVVLERQPQRNLSNLSPSRYAPGILFGMAAATGQAVGLVTAKFGLLGDFPALSGTLIRMLAAAAVLWTVTLLSGRAGPTIRQLSNHRKSLGLILGGSLTGPFLGVTFSLFAIQHSAIGVASTLMALPPVILLPVSYFVFDERFGWQAILGTLLSMAGVGLLFLV